MAQGVGRGVSIILDVLDSTPPDELVSVGWLTDRLRTLLEESVQDLNAIGREFTPEEKASLQSGSGASDV